MCLYSFNLLKHTHIYMHIYACICIYTCICIYMCIYTQFKIKETSLNGDLHSPSKSLSFYFSYSSIDCLLTIFVSYVYLLQTCHDRAQASAGPRMPKVIAKLFAVKQIKRTYSASIEPSSSLVASGTCGRAP